MILGYPGFYSTGRHLPAHSLGELIEEEAPSGDDTGVSDHGRTDAAGLCVGDTAGDPKNRSDDCAAPIGEMMKPQMSKAEN